jgi:hypothetical protein
MVDDTIALEFGGDEQKVDLYRKLVEELLVPGIEQLDDELYAMNEVLDR